MKYRNMVVDGRQLKAGRVLVGLTIQEMSALAGVNRNSVLRVESFEALPLYAYAAERIADALMSLGVLFIVQDGKPGVFFSGATRRTQKGYLK